MIIGLELLFNCSKNDIRSKEDALIIAIHSLLLQDGLKCTGTTEQESKKNKKGTELLPKDWNKDPDAYTLYYTNADGSCHILFKAVKSDNELLLNLLNLDTNASAALSVTINSHVSDNYTDVDSAYLNLEELQKNFSSGALKEVTGNTPQSSGSTSQKETNRRTDESSDPSSREPITVPPERSLLASDRYYGENPLSLGSSDLDPLGRVTPGGGMIMGPGHPAFGPRFNPSVGIPGRLPRGAIPPGARFDPFGPPGVGRFGSPDPDHLPPPGYDDMFM